MVSKDSVLYPLLKSWVLQNTYYMISFIWNSTKSKTTGTESRSTVACGQEWGTDYKGAWGTSGVTEMFYILTVVMVIGEYTSVKTYQTVLLKWVYFITCQLYLHKVGFIKLSLDYSLKVRVGI